MSSEHLASAKNTLKGNLGGNWNILDGASGQYQDLGMARRYGLSSAAYSLRDIGAMNGPVVKVRRSPHDAGDADGAGGSADTSPNDETNFSASQVQSGSLEDWVNGKQETTLPADVATAAGAYSLRKVKADYSGNAVRVRRTSDDVEVNVAFDSDDKVSASSPITDGGTELTPNPDADLGSTTDTDLNGFLNNEHTIDFAASSFSRVRFSRTDDQTIGGQIGDKFVVNGTGSNYYLYNTNFFDTNASGTSLGTSQSKQVLTFKYYVDSTESPNINHFHLKTGSAGNSAPFNETNVINVVKDSWQTVTLTVDSDNTSTGTRFYILVSNIPSSSNASTMTVGEAFYLQDIPITYSEVTAFVHTWYNQVGSNNAVQDTSANQPKIAENGALLDGILFSNGSDGDLGIHLQANSMTTGSATDNFVSAVVDRNSLTSTNMGSIISTRSGNSDGFTYGIHSQGYPQIFYTGNGNYGVDTQTLPTSGKVLLSFDKDNTVGTIHYNATTPTATNNSLSGYGNSSNVFNIGTINRPSVNPSNGFMGLMSEVIVYNSDQASNRFLIESNINNYYGLYNDANEMAEPWTSPDASVTNESKDGFTVTNPASGDYAFFELAIPAPLSTPSLIRVSFNADDPDDALKDISVRRTENGVSGSLVTINNGFNSLNVNNNAGGTAIGLQINFNAGTKTATLSDFKVSRIARNGFVETLYDQSKNDRDMTQDVAGYQPAIVLNGGIVKTNNGFIALRFDGTDDLLRTGDYTPAEASGSGLTQFSLMCVAGRPPTETQRVVASMGSQEGSHVIGGFYFSHNETSGQPTKQDIRFNISENGVTTPDNLSHIDQKIITATPLQDTNLLSFNRVASDNTFESFTMAGTKLTGTSLIPKTGQSASLGADFKIGASMYHGDGRRYYTGEILEVILFVGDNKRDDAPTINLEMKNHYDI